MSVTLRTYAHLDDAWADGLEAWCRESSDRVLRDGTRAWLVCATRGQGEWVKSRLLRAGVPVLGLSFLTASSLRRALCLRRGIPPPSGERQALGLLARAMASMEPGNRRCVAIARQPNDWLRALEELDAAGWLENQAEFARLVPPVLQPWVRRLRSDASEWLPGVDYRLRHTTRAREPDFPLRIAVLGWESSTFAKSNLLVAAAHEASEVDFYSPLPQIANELLQQQWLEWVEHEFTVVSEACDQRKSAVHANLAARLQGADFEREPLSAIGLLVGASCSDQVELISQTVVSWLGDPARREADRLAVVLPTRNVTSVSLGRRLTELEISHENTLGERPEPAWETRLVRALVDYHRDGATAAALLRLIAVRDEQATGKWLETATQALEQGFKRWQSGLARDASNQSSLRHLVEELGAWEDSAALPERRRQCERALSALHLASGKVESIDAILDPLWQSLEAHWPEGNAIDGAHWLEFLGEALNSVPTARAAGAANARHARIVLTTLAEAATQTWQSVILADANDEIWPIPLRENPFLPDGLRGALNARRGPRQFPLLRNADRAALDDVRFLALLENCDEEFFFAASGAVPDAPQRTAHPNEWLLRTLLESSPDPAAAWTDAIQALPRPSAPLAPAELQHVVAVHARRRDPKIPFDEYFLAFGPLAGRSDASWSARGLEALVKAPAQFAYKSIFDAEAQREGLGAFVRQDRLMAGTLAHRWMHELLRDNDGLQPASLHSALHDRLEALRRRTEQELAVQLPALGARSPGAWWRSVLALAERAARRWLLSLQGSALPQQAWQVEGERDFKAVIPPDDPGPRLRLHGRVDLCLLGESESVILDYKISDDRRAVQSDAVGADGQHLPLLAYLWLARAANLPHPRVGLVTAGCPADDALLRDADVDRFAPLLAQFTRQQHGGIFGQRGAVAAGEHGDEETLPMATVPITPEILAAKAEASGLVAEAVGILAEDNHD